MIQFENLLMIILLHHIYMNLSNIDYKQFFFQLKLEEYSCANINDY